MSRNKKILDSFVKYCTEHPEERFWQAIRNWSTYGYIWVSNTVCRDPNCLDTYYWEDKKYKKMKTTLPLM